MSANKKKNPNDSINLKYLIGDMGFEILLAIEKGARKKETIKLLSGVPMECINGRLPVLIDLNLISKNNEEFYITERGIEFKKRVKFKNKI